MAGTVARMEGLTEFRKALKEAAKVAPLAVTNANQTVAREITDEATSNARSYSRQAAKAAKSLRVSKSVQSAAIMGGGSRAAFFHGAEFGAKQYRQFPAFRGNQWRGWDGGPGYFLHPAIKSKGPKAMERYLETIERITRRAFPD